MLRNILATRFSFAELGLQPSVCVLLTRQKDETLAARARLKGCKSLRLERGYRISKALAELIVIKKAIDISI